MDGRCRTFRVLSESKALDTANDVLALSQEGRVRLVMLAQEAQRLVEAAYERHVMDDWSGYLALTDRLNRTLIEIRDLGRRWADDVTSSPEISPDQLPLALAA